MGLYVKLSFCIFYNNILGMFANNRGMIEKNEFSWNICGFKGLNYFFYCVVSGRCLLLGVSFCFHYCVFMDKMILSKVDCFMMRKK